MEKTLFEMKCSYCNKIYQLREYSNNNVVFLDEKPTYDIKTVTSHGICKICLQKVLKENGLEYKIYKIK